MRLYNIDAQAQVVDHDLPGVKPGDGFDFADEERARALLSAGGWTELDPRRGLEAEQEFKAERDAVPGDVEADTPSESEETAE